MADSTFLLVLLVHQEVLDGQGAGLAHRACAAVSRMFGLARGGSGAALLVAVCGARLLRLLAVGGAHLQLQRKFSYTPLAGLASPVELLPLSAAHKARPVGRQ